MRGCAFGSHQAGGRFEPWERWGWAEGQSRMGTSWVAPRVLEPEKQNERLNLQWSGVQDLELQSQLCRFLRVTLAL